MAQTIASKIGTQLAEVEHYLALVKDHLAMGQPDEAAGWCQAMIEEAAILKSFLEREAKAKKAAPKLAPGIFVIKLSSVGNPDFGQYAPVSEPEVVYAKTLKEIVKAAMAYQEKWDLGSGNWTNPAIGQDGKFVAYISYNGRLWISEGKEYKA